MGKLKLVVLGFAAAVTGAAVARPAPAQTAPEFESASIKLSVRGNVRGSTFQFLPGGGLRIQNGTLKDLIESAYDVRDFQVLGASGWMSTESYDLIAKSPSTDTLRPTAAENISATRIRLQALLADRFRLTVQRTRRDLPGYALRVAKKGVKVKADTTVETRGGIEASC